MNRTTHFDPSGELIVVSAKVLGPLGPRRIELAIDTGSSETVLAPDIVDDLGYSPRNGEQITRVRSAVSEERGYILRVARFEALGYAFADYRIHVFDLAAGYGIDGLLGLSFLRQFDCEFRFRAGTITLTQT